MYVFIGEYVNELLQNRIFISLDILLSTMLFNESVPTFSKESLRTVPCETALGVMPFGRDSCEYG